MLRLFLLTLSFSPLFAGEDPRVERLVERFAWQTYWFGWTDIDFPPDTAWRLLWEACGEGLGLCRETECICYPDPLHDGGFERAAIERDWTRTAIRLAHSRALLFESGAYVFPKPGIPQALRLRRQRPAKELAALRAKVGCDRIGVKCLIPFDDGSSKSAKI